MARPFAIFSLDAALSFGLARVEHKNYFAHLAYTHTVPICIYVLVVVVFLQYI